MQRLADYLGQLKKKQGSSRKKLAHTDLPVAVPAQSQPLSTFSTSIPSIAMKIPMICSVCAREAAEKGQTFAARSVVLRDDETYASACERGHTTVFVLLQRKPEVLFDHGAWAFGDGYFREAVSSFTAALERFYEFAIRVILRSNGVDTEVGATAWKSVASASERQFGAFVMLWTAAFREDPEANNDKERNFRNGVIHKGVLPTPDATMKYGEAILERLRRWTQRLNEEMGDHVEQQIKSEMRSVAAHPSALRLSIEMLFALDRAEEHPFDAMGLDGYVTYHMGTRQFWEKGLPVTDGSTP